ncbi:MAG: YggT family protein [Candidatus Saccharimonadales bacterium]
MSEFKETVTTSKDQATDVSGAQVNQEVRKVNTEANADGRSMAINAIWFILGVIEVMIGLRFVLKILGANPANAFVDFIYSVTGVLTAPFDTIFGVTSAPAGQVVKSVFEPSILVAAAIYALLAWGIVKLLTLNRPA